MRGTRIAGFRTRSHSAPGGFRPLRQRLTPAQVENRAVRIAARRQVAEVLQQQMASITSVVNLHTALMNRGFFGRLRWLVLGR